MGPSSPPAQPHTPPKLLSCWSSYDSDLETTSPLGRKEATPKELGGLQVNLCRVLSQAGKEEEATVSYPQPEAHLAILELDPSFISYHPKPSAPRHHRETQPGLQWKARVSTVAAASWLVLIPTSTSRATSQEILIAMMPNTRPFTP